MRAQTTILLLWGVCVALLPAQAVEGLLPGETSRETDGIFPGAIPLGEDGVEAWLVSRVVDAVSGEPLAGVRVAAYAEHMQVAPRTWSAVRATTTGEDGWARLRVDDIRNDYDWILYERPGYGPLMNMSGREQVELWPGRDVPVHLVDHLERPVRGAVIDLILGCGHTPAVRTVLTDDHGRALVPCVGPRGGELWPVAPGILSEYTDLDVPRAGDPPLLVRTRPARASTGLVLDPEGRPAPGVAVGTPQCHRGPWTTTDAHGRFRLLGSEDASWVMIVPPDSPADAVWHATMPPPEMGIERILRLTEQPDYLEDETGQSLTVTSVEAGSGMGIEVPLVAVRLRDGLTVGDETDVDGRAELTLPDGLWRIRAGARPGAWAPAQTDIEIGPDAPATLRLELTRNPALRVRLPEAARGQVARVQLATEDFLSDVTDAVESGSPLPVPPQGAAWLRVRIGDRVALAPLPPAGLRTEGALIEAPVPAATFIRVRLRDGDGAPVEGRATLHVSPPDLDDDAPPPGVGPQADSLLLQTWRDGRIWIAAWPADEALRPATRELLLPPVDRDDPSDLVIELQRQWPAVLSVSRPDGAPAAGARVVLRRQGRQTWSSLDAAGLLRTEQPIASGEHVRVEAAGLLPLVVRLDGEGPWALAWPDTKLRLEVTDPQGAALPAFILILDGEELDQEGNPVLLAGLPGGRHELIIAAPGCRSRVLELLVEPELERHLRVPLWPVTR